MRELSAPRHSFPHSTDAFWHCCLVGGQSFFLPCDNLRRRRAPAESIATHPNIVGAKLPRMQMSCHRPSHTAHCSSKSKGGRCTERRTTQRPKNQSATDERLHLARGAADAPQRVAPMPATWSHTALFCATQAVRSAQPCRSVVEVLGSAADHPDARKALRGPRS